MCRSRTDDSTKRRYASARTQFRRRSHSNVHRSCERESQLASAEQHLELDERLTLKQAHDRVSAMESEIIREVPEISTILTHIESEPATIEAGNQVMRDATLERRLKAAIKDFPEILDMHELELKRVRGRLYISCHCTMADDLPLSRVHDIQTDLESRFKMEAPELFRVLIHPEPRTDNRR